MSIKINDIRDQHKKAQERMKMTLFHAEAMKTNCEDVERCKALVREAERSLLDARLLLTLSEEYAAIKRN